MAVVISVLPDVEHVDDVRVAYRGRGFRFRMKSLPEDRIAGELRLDELRRYLPVEQLVGCRPDIAHAAGGYACGQPVPARKQRARVVHVKIPFGGTRTGLYRLQRRSFGVAYPVTRTIS